MYGVHRHIPQCYVLQLTPLLLVTDHDSGGYNMDDSEIGVVLMSAAVLQLAFQVHCMAPVANLVHFSRLQGSFPASSIPYSEKFCWYKFSYIRPKSPQNEFLISYDRAARPHHAFHIQQAHMKYAKICTI